MEWLSEDGLKAIEKMGWPEWDGSVVEVPGPLFPKCNFILRCFYEASRSVTKRVLHDRQALALLRDFAREYEEKHGAFVCGNGTGWDALGIDGNYIVNGSGMTFDQVHVAAVLAVEVK